MIFTIPDNAKWLPAYYMDETVPPTRATPGAWVVGNAEAGWYLVPSELARDDTPTPSLTEGEVVEFYAMVEIASPNVTVAFDEDGGRIWHADPPGPFEAPHGFELSVYDGESVYPGMDDAAYELEEGQHEMEVYAWTASAIRFRFTEGRFEPVRQDG